MHSAAKVLLSKRYALSTRFVACCYGLVTTDDTSILSFITSIITVTS